MNISKYKMQWLNNRAKMVHRSTKFNYQLEVGKYYAKLGKNRS